ncbi:toll/interleukin-1 receptor domain-containing protein [Legionella rowbothamii]|uniref:toll/interleukin-1 receptor domain-containing protein n=1 Tax=Legionella rowbothamii TaxID=96229 RepID=UPI0010543B14|nr:toll/interleukin-1 receptor domain-containing protein [Legionella rowbothamii]
MIFISHNHMDKTIIEPIALRLREIFGEDKVFYDSWSIQPGDGIIDKMNQALGACQLFLFFVSKNSLLSNMVKLEWQNAIMKSTGTDIKIIPVKLDSCLMPPILMQSLYIDLFGQGLEIALRQIVDVAEGRNTFQPGPQHFSNLRAYFYKEEEKTIIECHAEHFLEPISSFFVLVENQENEISIKYRGSMYMDGKFQEIKLDNGQVYNGKNLGIDRGTLPGFPFIIEITPQNNATVKLKGVMHQKSQTKWEQIPLSLKTS